MGSNKEDVETRIVVIWDSKGIKIQSTATNPTVIAALEMAKALMIQQTVGPGKKYQAGEATLMRSPTLLGRKVDVPAS